MIGLQSLIASVLVAGIIAGFGGAPAPTMSLLPTPLPQQLGCQRAREPRPLCIVILGDSIAAGWPLSGHDRWWVRLQSLLSSALPDRQVVVDNWAVSGSRVNVLDSAARDQPSLDSFDIAIVIEGVNDASAVPIDVWRPLYAEAITSIESRGLVVVVGTPPPVFANGAFASGADATAAALRQIAAGRYPLLDIAARWRADGATIAATYYLDWIHQGDVGQRLMADMARNVVLGMLGSQ